jgi:hypothetical protein
MDGSLRVDEVMVELATSAQQATTWSEVRVSVRAWAAKHWFLPCTTTPTATGLQIAYHDDAEGCKQVFVPLPSQHAHQVWCEYEAGKGGW